MPDSHIWEEDPVSLKVRAQGVKYSNKAVKFVFKTDDANAVPVGTADVTIKSNTFSANEVSGRLDKTTKPADVAGSTFDALYYRARYEITVAGQTKKNFTDRIWVYSRTIHVKAVDATDATKAFEGALCRLIQQPAPGSRFEGNPAYVAERETDADGKIDFALYYPSSELMLEWVRPYYGEWLPGKDTGTKREAKITYAPKAKLEFPEGGDGVRMQYVNLPEDPEPDLDKRQRDRGRVIHVVATLVNPSEWKAGQRCFLKATFGAKNSDRIGAVKKKGQVLELETAFGADKKATFDIDLGPAGGDEVAIEVGTFKGKADDKCSVQTWRRLWYELMAPQAMVDEGKLVAKTGESGDASYDLPGDAVDWLEKRLAQGFVEYKLWKSHVFADLLTDGFVVDGAFVAQEAGKKLYVLGGKYKDEDPVPFSAAESRTVHVRLCDVAVGKPASANVTKPLQTAKATFKTGGDHCFKKSMADGTPSIKNARWSADVADGALQADGTTPHPGTEADGSPKSGTIPADWFTWKTSKEIELELQGDAATLVGPATDTTCNILVSFDWALSYELCGSALLGRQLLGYEKQHKYMASSIAHELGHLMGMAVFPSDARGRKKTTPEGMPDPKVVSAGPYYDDAHGHSGSHCAVGLDLTSATFEGGPEGTCIMYGEGAPRDEPQQIQFCATCRTYLKARKLEDVRSTWRTRSADQA